MTARTSALLVVIALVVAGCGGPSGRADAPPASQSAGYQPATVTDCNGRQVTFTAPPQRVVALTTSVLELLFWLGVADKVVGIGSPPKAGTFPPEFDAAAQRLPHLAGSYAPGSYKAVPREQMLGARPDFVLGGFTSNFDADGAMKQQELADNKINSYLALSTSCPAATTSARGDFELVYRDLRNLGAIFGVQDRAERLIADMRAKTDDVARKLAGTPPPAVFPFEFDEGTQTPYAPGNRQAVNATLSLAGARNIFGDLNKPYQKISWEEVAKRNPEAILLIVYDKGNPAETEARFAAAESFAKSFPVLAGTPAVRGGRFARLVYEQGSNGGVRNADAVVSLARQLFPEKMR
ncbi:iron complex transport system substrate-binding protein [Herbihabitans rhizosphaerae]|uniref:Iron complex transport system substrate-binding protein n=1 Tax=Herbihabitans rhizosphaerae TaxID=1872711 RepID=A0A4V2EUI9_9PSEU|nr:ABC transporter substrate-binding protein [Herbihabitans rhizosphaerae]RZS44733.1 iron complex transport system substrate-binding protein [Herbihabitans rhizosphaerae]